jgi:hypothetical protein
MLALSMAVITLLGSALHLRRDSLGIGGQLLLDELPVDQVVQEGVDVGVAVVLVVQVVCNR